MVSATTEQPPKEIQTCNVRQHSVLLMKVLCSSLTEWASDVTSACPAGSLAQLADIVSDEAFLFRFLVKAKMSEVEAHKFLVQHWKWRFGAPNQKLRTGFGLSGLSMQARKYLDSGIFRFHGQDCQGRPCLIINLGRYNASEGKNHVAEFMECLVFVLEVGRRCIHAVNMKIVRSMDSLSQPNNGSDWVVEANAKTLIHNLSVIVDLNGVGLNNVNYELMPLLFGIFKSHYPGIFGTLYVLNFGWLHSGMWSIVKPALSAEACKKLLFLTKEEMHMHFDTSSLLQEHGGLASEVRSHGIFSMYSLDPPAHPNSVALLRSLLDTNLVFSNDKAQLPPLPSPVISAIGKRKQVVASEMSPRLKAGLIKSPFLSGEAFYTPMMKPNTLPPSPFVSAYGVSGRDIWFDTVEDFALSPAWLSSGTNVNGKYSPTTRPPAELWSPGMVVSLRLAKDIDGLGDLELPASAVEEESCPTIVEDADVEEIETPRSVFGSIGSRDVEDGPECCECRCCRNRGSRKGISMWVWGVFQEVAWMPWGISVGISKFILDHMPQRNWAVACAKCRKSSKDLMNHTSSKGRNVYLVNILASIVFVSGAISVIRWWRFFSRNQGLVSALVSKVEQSVNLVGIQHVCDAIVAQVFG